MQVSLAVQLLPGVPPLCPTWSPVQMRVHEVKVTS